MWFGLVIRLVGLLQLITTCNNKITDLHLTVLYGMHYVIYVFTRHCYRKASDSKESSASDRGDCLATTLHLD